MHALIEMVHVLASLMIILLVLLQQGKGSDMGASMGAGVTQSVFGGQGSGQFLFRATTIAAAVFMSTSLTLGHMATKQHQALQSMYLPATVKAKQGQEKRLPQLPLTLPSQGSHEEKPLPRT